MHAIMCVCMYVCTHACMHACMSACMYVRMYALTLHFQLSGRQCWRERRILMQTQALTPNLNQLPQEDQYATRQVLARVTRQARHLRPLSALEGVLWPTAQ